MDGADCTEAVSDAVYLTAPKVRSALDSVQRMADFTSVDTLLAAVAKTVEAAIAKATAETWNVPPLDASGHHSDLMALLDDILPDESSMEEVTV
ncbi:hypothetical protein LEN26_016292 [Aphanomyces euteiches]|nr:hypothetical protein LEN26_016292 [Aphanomyces euteiches]KAH9105351.1 hypothetical protein AeMF1_018802 [Aphanomyces euteiches]